MLFKIFNVVLVQGLPLVFDSLQITHECIYSQNIDICTPNSSFKEKNMKYVGLDGS